ncbi:carnitine dehydratase [Candidatus Epulonipiscium fishelsonii]|uniref:Carnitine dehydratase n=1 Tax=Candidatus Epulonipiscium fishelsonii TaxID=77094 RepID=A0ACC8XCH4_9FIRM|nr:carnitine dehydratase [Epulopiscium sp. SCG-B11WGA-EpuloA1]ONI41772.1 carnitine dehydratase [Epulopiscium sp. SCG-B05WGA-EpuloA1]
MKPLEGMLVLDFAQYLAGPSAALRLADLGARVVKIERPQGGDNGRRLVFKNLVSDNDGVLFHTINRNKESFTADLKNPEDVEVVKQLIKKADVLIENFRPGIMDKLGLGYDEVKKINKRIVYGTVSGYGVDGPWVKRPGQDLMLQSLSGLAWMTGSQDDLPLPIALAMADTYSGIHLVQGILSCLYRRFKTGEGGKVEVSLLESILDLQFEFIATYINDNYTLPKRAKVNNAHVYLPAPYGIYTTKDSYIALAMGSLATLGEVLQIPELSNYNDDKSRFEKRDEIKLLIQEKLNTDTTANWIKKLKEVNYWCSEVLNWKEVINHPAFTSLDMLINVGRPGHRDIITTRCPIRVDGETYKSNKWAPALGEDTEKIMKEYGLKKGGQN